MRDSWYAQMSTYWKFKPILWLVRSLERYCVKKADFVYTVTGSLILEFKEAGKKVIVTPNAAKLKEIKKIRLPNSEIVRSLVIIDKTSPTPHKYPRRAGMAKKKPLQ